MTQPLLFIPGLMQDARAFLPQMVALGQGRSVQVFTCDAETVEKLSEQALAAAPPRFAVIGHGLGGNVALDILRRSPERVSHLVLFSTDPLSEPPQVAASREARMVAARAGRLKEAILEDVPETSLAEGPDRAALIMLMRDVALAWGKASNCASARRFNAALISKRHCGKPLSRHFSLPGRRIPSHHFVVRNLRAT